MEFLQSGSLQCYPSKDVSLDNSVHTNILYAQGSSQEETIGKIQRKALEELEAKNNDILKKKYYISFYRELIDEARTIVQQNPHFQLIVLGEHLEKIERHFYQNRIHESKREVKRALKIFPSNIDFKRYLARVLCQQRKNEKAERAFKEALFPYVEKNDPNIKLFEIDFRFEYAAFLDHMDRCEEAYELLKDTLLEMLQVNPQWRDIQNILILAKLCYRLGKYDELRQIVNTQFSEKSDFTSPFTLGRILLAFDKKRASEYLHRFFNNFDKNSTGALSSEYCMNLGYLSLLKNQSDSAKSFFAWALKKRPNIECATYYLKYFMSPVDSNCNLKESRNLIKKLLLLNTGNNYNLMKIILICREYVDDSSAMKLYIELKKRLDEPCLSEFEGWWERSKGNLKSSAEFLVEAFQIAPKDPSILRSYGETLRKLGNLNDAEKLIKQSLKLEENMEARLSYGLVLFDSHRFSEAKIQFELIFWSMPFHVEALKGYEATLRAMGLHEQAEEQKIMIDQLCIITK